MSVLSLRNRALQKFIVEHMHLITTVIQNAQLAWLIRNVIRVVTYK